MEFTKLTFLLLTFEVGASDGSGMKLAIIAKKMTPEKNYRQLNKWVSDYSQTKNGNTISTNILGKLKVKKIAYPNIPFQEANRIYGIVSQIKKWYAKHKTCSEALQDLTEGLGIWCL